MNWSCKHILKRINKLAYELDLPAYIAVIHPVCHKCVDDPASAVPLESVVVKYCLCYEDVPVEIIDHQIRRIRSKEVASVNVWWRIPSVKGSS